MLDNPEALAARYGRDGYVFPLTAMTAAQAARYRARLEAVEAEVKDDPARRKTLRRYSNVVLDFVDEITRLPAITDAVAALLGPDLLVLDEPTQQVDFSGQLELFERIAELRKTQGCGILMISHDLHVVMAATDRVVCLNQHICCSGEPEAVSRHPEYLQLFGTRAARVMAVYSHEHDHEHGLTGEVIEHDHHQDQNHGHDHHSPKGEG